MKKTISLFLSIVMLFSALTASVNAYAAGWASKARRVNLNTDYHFYVDAGHPDYVSLLSNGYYFGMIIDVPANGKITYHAECNSNSVLPKDVSIYKSSDLNNPVLEFSSNYDYSSAYDMYYLNRDINLNKGQYYVMLDIYDYSDDIADGDSDGSFNVRFNYSVSLAKPSGFKVKSRNTSSINLTWNKVGGATGYHLQRKINGSYSFVTNTSRNYYNVTGLRAGIRYDFRIRTFVEINGTRYYSGWTYFQTPTKPNKPAIKAPKTNWNDDIIIYWNKVSACSGYQVQYSRTSNFSRISYTKYTSYRNSSFTGHNFWYGYRYYVRVRAYKEVNGVKCFGAWSDSRSIVCQ